MVSKNAVSYVLKKGESGFGYLKVNGLDWMEKVGCDRVKKSLQNEIQDSAGIS